MISPLSEQLAKLSVRAKKVEDDVHTAQAEAHEKIVARRDHARAEAAAALQHFEEKTKAVGDALSSHASSIKAKISGDLATLKGKVESKKQQIDASLAAKHADHLEQDAEYAITYALAAIDQAEAAALDALAARVEADQLKR
jgi:hypothetical protein